jgi:hypothetical protein
VKEQERVYAALRDELTRRYVRVANLVTATHFGLQIDPTLWQPLADFAAGRALAAPAKFSDWIAEAERLAARRRRGQARICKADGGRVTVGRGG